MKRVCLIFVVLAILGSVRGDLKMGFYSSSCPNAEKIVQDYVNQRIPKVPLFAAALIRLHFHDCFVRGCDASLLLNVTSASGNQTEKFAIPNQTILGFEFIDQLKSLVEAECPGVVSCADIVTLATRDSIVVIGGPYWKVPTGRRDGLVSNAPETFTQIPAPFDNITILQQKFANKGLNLKDLVILSGAHTIGVAHCPSFSNRLYNFTGRGDQDPSLDSEYAKNLRSRKCTTPNDNTTLVEMDPVEMGPGSSSKGFILQGLGSEFLQGVCIYRWSFFHVGEPVEERLSDNEGALDFEEEILTIEVQDNEATPLSDEEITLDAASQGTMASGSGGEEPEFDYDLTHYDIDD
ncbi:peroxidase 3-like protein [Tanacetum coccineum]